MRARLAHVVLVLAGLVAPGLAVAQPPPPPPVIEPASSSANAPRSVWRFGLSAEGAWYDNARFLGPVVEDAAWSTTGRASLSNSVRFRDGTFSISGFGGAIYYPEFDALNQPTYGGSLGLDWKASQNSRINLSVKYELSNTRLITAVDAEGLPLPTSTSDYTTAAAGWEVRLSRRWALATEASYRSRGYDDVLLSDSEQVFAGFRLGRQLGRRGLFHLSYVYASSWFDEGKERAHQALIGARHAVERGVGFEFAGGVGYIESNESLYPAGRVGLYAVGRKARFDLVYYRDFGQAYGYGRQMIGDIATARLTWTSVRRVTFDASYNYAYRRDPTEEDYTIRSGIASAGFGWDVGGGVGFAAKYSYEKNDTTGFSAFEGSRVTATLSYGVSWR